jgi:hypothetical protein
MSASQITSIHLEMILDQGRGYLRLNNAKKYARMIETVNILSMEALPFPKRAF